MKTTENISLTDVQNVYNGPEGKLWEMIMGQQIHIGGLASSTDLAEKAGIKAGMKGVDLCCCNGAGMRFLIRFCQVSEMTGVDAAETVIEHGRKMCDEEGLADNITFIQADVCQSGLTDGSVDFVWGEDAWCYVVDKPKLIAEAVRIVKPGGTIAFTDWIEGASPMTDSEAERLLKFMKFASIDNLQDYREMLVENNCRIIHCADTGRFASHVDLYLNMLNMQLTYDALKIIGFDSEVMAYLAGEMVFMQELAHAGKIAQGLFVACKS